MKVAVPLTAALVRVPLKMPPLGLLPMARIILVLLVVTLPNGSRMRTVTAGAMAAVAVVSLGCTQKTSWVAGPGTMFALNVGDVSV